MMIASSAEASNNEGKGSDNDNVVGIDDDDNNEGNLVIANKCDRLTLEEAMEGEINVMTECAKVL